MFSVYLPHALAAIAKTRIIKQDDLPVIDEIIHADVAIMNDEIEWLCHLDQVCMAKDFAWVDYYVRTTVDYVVNQADPRGHVDGERMSWLLECLTEDGMIRTSSGLEVILGVLETAEQVPEWVTSFALNQVRAGIVYGRGPLGAGVRRIVSGVGGTDVDVLRRILVSCRQFAHQPLSRMEIDILFDINDQTDEERNDPAWSDLFVKCAANFMVAGRRHRVPDRQTALAPAAWLTQNNQGSLGIFRRLAVGLLPHSLEEFWRDYRSDKPAIHEVLGFSSNDHDKRSEAEIKWVIDRIGRDRALHENEKALLTFLSLETPDLHPSLRTLLDTAA